MYNTKYNTGITRGFGHVFATEVPGEEVMVMLKMMIMMMMMMVVVVMMILMTTTTPTPTAAMPMVTAT